MTIEHRLLSRRLPLALCAAVNSANAATLIVDDPAATSLAGKCTIVDAVASLNQHGTLAGSTCVNGSSDPFGTNDTIRFSSNYTITFVDAGVKLTLKVPATIDGGIDASGKPQVTLEMDPATPPATFAGLIVSTTTGTLTLRGITVKGATYDGIEAQGSVNLINAAVIGNAYSGVRANGDVTITNSTISDNVGIFVGGVAATNITVINSTISGNISGPSGAGGLGADSIHATNSTFIGNSAATPGTAMKAKDATLDFCTINGNVPFNGGTPAVYASSSISVTGSVVSNNGSAPDITLKSGGTVAGDYNIIGSLGTGTSLSGTHNKTCDPALGSLADNGGPTPTMALLPTSCAFDAGPATTTIATDQRGRMRPVGAAADIGAFERQLDDPPDEIFVNGFDL